MADDERPLNLSAALSSLPPKTRAPNSARVLDAWITQAETKLGSTRGRLGWLVASTVVTSALQQAVDDQGHPLFLLKGGTLLQHRLPGSRATTDLDGLARGSIESFLDAFDEVSRHPWGPLTLRRDPVEIIDVPGKLVKPRRFDVVVMFNGVTWRRIQVEVSPDEGSAGIVGESVPAPALGAVGLPAPDHLVGLAMRYQIAQKVHAATDPHMPPEYVNDRARDAVDLLLLRDLANESGHPSMAGIRAAIEDIFGVRAAEAAATGCLSRSWPARLVAYAHWHTSYRRAAESAGVTLTLEEAVAEVNLWLDSVDRAMDDC
ncbi:nucleotidyl transferase AbiEii/AbiGii toxin family protein [Brooklawnia cerclae]|uniref:Nucleotidyl transferase AbiEii/AbiGii toxin family protein n=1 Tax=Brooklawnia cerclae TaxID=349934 RepID=A0ABX0SI46_9ACTN|nr:nucleotidyl transferase AbiEii/AbiGii toxin family protein [Brooklawnia cerclae]NIH58070.1 hypothetical protein [Brooklawnia cerclae]